MKTPSRFLISSPLAALALALLCVSSPLAFGQSSFWQGNASGNGEWSNPANWSNGVPQSSSAAFIGSPYLDVDATVSSLTFQTGDYSAPVRACGFAPCITDNRNPRDLIVGTTSFQDLSGGVIGPTGYRFGFTITVADGSNFQLGTTNLPAGVLVGQWTVEDWDGTKTATPALVQFRDADIHENRGSVFLRGPDAAIRDQNTGANAFRNFATNNRHFFLADGNVLSTTGNLTNNDELYLFNFGEGDPTRLTVGGGLINNSGGYIQIQGGGQVTVTGNFQNNGTPPDGVLLVNSNLTVGDTILNVQGTLTNAANASIDLAGTPNRCRLIVGGDLNNAGLLSITGAGSLQVAGMLNVIAPGKITIEDDGGSEGSRLAAGQINLAANTTFDAQGTIFSYVVGNGVFSPGLSSPGGVTINGGLALTDTAHLGIHVGGRVPRAGYDEIRHITPTPPSTAAGRNAPAGTTNVTLDGVLDISFIGGFEKTITAQDTFSILVSDRMLSGAFNNVASGGRLRTSDGHGTFQVTYAGQNSVVLSEFEVGPLSVVSRKTHGASGAFDIPLLMTGTPSVEPRLGSGPSQNEHRIVATFAGPVTFGSASVTSGTGSVTSAALSGNEVVIDLAGVANAQQLAITLTNVSNGATANDVVLPLRVLLGDINGNGTVTASDIGQTKSRSGVPVDATNFRSDVVANGSINATDIGLVKSRSGSTLPQ